MHLQNVERQHYSEALSYLYTVIQKPGTPENEPLFHDLILLKIQFRFQTKPHRFVECRETQQWIWNNRK